MELITALKFYCSILLLESKRNHDLAPAHQKPRLPACYNMTLTAKTKDPKFKTRLVLKQFGRPVNQTMGSMLRRNAVIKIMFMSTEPLRRGRIMKAITLSCSLTKSDIFFRVVPIEMLV